MNVIYTFLIIYLIAGLFLAYLYLKEEIDKKHELGWYIFLPFRFIALVLVTPLMIFFL